MRRILILFLALACFTGCKKDEENTTTSSSTPKYEDRNLQGKIEGNSWEFVSGKFTPTKISDTEQGYSIVMYPQQDTTLCSLNLKKWDKVLFTSPAVAGSYDLSFDFSNLEDSRTVTLYSEKDNINNIATEGSYEIVTVDTVRGIMEIKMNVSADDNNAVNGKATLAYCR